MLPSIADVVAKVKPSVVAINVKITVNNPFFGTTIQEGAGSGWIIDGNGIIVTNNHVVEGAQSITVTLDDGRTFPATIVGTDFLTDLAVVKIDASNLESASVGNSSELMLGEWVLAIGNSLGLGVTPAEGIVRSLGASVTISPGQTLHDLIGTSAPRINLIPILADARDPVSYTNMVTEVDIIYQDVAQRGQAEIAIRNAELFLKKGGLLVLIIKSRSIDSVKNTDEVSHNEIRNLGELFKVTGTLNLEPFHSDHAVVLAQKQS